MLYDCSGPSFRNIKNPYTGERMPVKMLVAPGGRLLFASPGAFHPGGFPQPTTRDAFRQWDREDGVEGVRSARGPVVCAWTRRPLSPKKTPEGWVYAGGFDPTVFRPRDEFLYYATMRDGKATRPKPEPAVRVDQPPRRGEITEGMRRGVEERAAKPDDETLAAAAKIAGAAGLKSPTVSMHVPAKKKRGK